MERDFMGLSAVKQEEVSDETAIDSAAGRGNLAMQWSFSDKGSSSSSNNKLLSFHGAPEEKTKTGFESLASTGLVTITTTQAFDSDHKSYSGGVQKKIVPEKQGAVNYMFTTYPPHQMHRAQDVRNIPIMNQTISLPMGAPLHHSFVSPAGLTPMATNLQPLTRVPVANPMSVVPPGGPVVGTTELRNGTEPSPGPAQLTIFYAGSVCVYNNVSPEKAQAIMLLAGNGPPVAPNMTISAAPIRASPPMPSIGDGFVGNQPYGPRTRVTSHIPSTAISLSQSAGDSTNNKNSNSTSDVKPLNSNKVEPLNSLTSIPANFISSGGVPQARRKSLFRFLEKRKERVISASPYMNGQSSDCSTPPVTAIN